MDLPPVGTGAPPWTAVRIIRLVLGVVLALLGGVLGLTLIIGFLLHPDALERTFEDGTPTWPFQLGWVLVNAGIAFVGVRIARSQPRMRAPREGATVPSKRVAAHERWTVRAVIRVIIGILLLPVGALVIIAAIGLIATSGWDYLFSDAPNKAAGDSNLGVIVTLGTVGVMIVLGGYSLVVDRHQPRAPRRVPADTAVARTGHHAE